MNGPATPIFDMILGDATGLGQPSIGVTPGDPAAAPVLFGAVLGDMLSPQASINEGVPSAPGAETAGANLLELLTSNLNGAENDVPANTAEITGLATPATDLDQDQDTQSADADDNGKLISEAVQLLMPNISGAMPVTPQSDPAQTVDNQFKMQNLFVLGNGRSIPTTIPKDAGLNNTNLKSGIYQITDQELSEGNLVLTLQADNESEPTKLKLPVDGLPIKPNAVNIPLFNKEITAADLPIARILKDLNLKQVEIKDIEPTDKNDVEVAQHARTQPNAVVTATEMSLTGEQPTETLVIRRKLQATDSSSDRVKPAVSKHESGKDDNSSDQKATIFGKDKPNPVPGLDEHRQLLKQDGTGDHKTDMLATDKSGGNKNHVSIEGTGDLSGQRTIKLDASTQVQPHRPTHPVRFTLPDDIRTALLPGGKSVTIAIEPEHLGHARLNLYLHDDGLRGRVVVQSVEAKTMVEKSLNQLTDQLSRADIKVDSFSVTVSSQHGGNQFFRQPGTRHNQFIKPGKFDATKFENENIVVDTEYRAPRQSHLSSAAVDVMA